MDPTERPIDPADPESGLQVEETGSLADFAAKYAGESRRSEPTIEDAGDAEPLQPVEQPRGRHRSRSQQAKPDDQKAIAEYTKRLRDAEGQIGVKIERQDGESERVYNLRRRAELAEAIAKKSKDAPVAQPIARPLEQPSAFSEKEPTIAEFLNDPSGDAYSAWQRALGRYDRRKEAFEADQEKIKAGLDTRQKAEVEAKANAYKAFGERIAVFKAEAKDYDAVIAKAPLPIPPLMETAMIVDPEGQRYGYLLAKNHVNGIKPEIFDELFLFSDGKVVNHETVAAMRRLLKSRLQAASTGSAAPQNVVEFPPKPPNPVRTGRMRSSSETPPNPDDLSLSQFESAYPNRKRR